jgi:O-antigen/teichoic acid export membrane protein
VKDVATAAAWSLLRHVLVRGSVFGSTIIVARMLNTEALAAYMYFQVTVAMIAAWSMSGIGVTASKVFANFQLGNTEDCSRQIKALSGLVVAASCIAALLVFTIPAAWLVVPSVVPRWLLALGVSAAFFGAFSSSAVIGTGRFREAAFAAAVGGCVLLASVFIGGAMQSVTVAMVGLSLAALIQGIGELKVTVGPTVSSILRGRLDVGWLETKRVFYRSLPMGMVSILSATGTWLVSRMIRADGLERDFALYAIGMQWFSLGMVLPGVLAQVTFAPIMRATGASGNATSDAARIRHYAVVTSGAALVIGFGCLLAGPYLFSIYGREYVADWWVAPAFVTIAVLAAPINIVGNALVGANKQRTWLALHAVSFAVTVAFVCSFLHLGGAVAAALGHAFGMGVLLAGAVAAGRKNGLL